MEGTSCTTGGTSNPIEHAPDPRDPRHPPRSTHDINASIYRVTDFREVAKQLEYAANKASFNCGSISRYTTVNVLLLSWEESEDDDLTFTHEIEDVRQVFADVYGFNVERCLLPGHKAHPRPAYILSKTVNAWVGKYDSDTNLFIVYYAGHGSLSPTGEALWSSGERTKPHATVRSIVFEDILHEAASDTLFLLDCCFAAGSASRPLRGFSETIAACGWEATALQPGIDSFTTVLVSILRRWASAKPSGFSVVSLHNELLAQLKSMARYPVYRDGDSRVEYQLRATPVHYIRSSTPLPPSIILSPRQRPSTDSRATSTDDQSRTPATIDRNIFDERSRPTIKLRPRVVLTITLAEDVPDYDSPDACSRWLASFPLPTQDCKVEGLYQGLSTVVLLSIPVETWDLLPDIPGCNFVCFITSENLLLSKPGHGQAPAGSSELCANGPGRGRYLAERSINLPVKLPAETIEAKVSSPQKPPGNSKK